jgi:Asp-tRNA(Asn)/Glu-tRNA(Gln) amidotransferase A subunit family amidase
VIDLETLTICEAAERLAGGSLSSTQLVEAILWRIDETEPLVHAYAHVMSESALAAAARADKELAQGRVRGPLHDIPIGVKDVFSTHDAPTQAGSRVLAGFVPPEDADSACSGPHLLGGLCRLRRSAARCAGHADTPTGAHSRG